MLRLLDHPIQVRHGQEGVDVTSDHSKLPIELVVFVHVIQVGVRVHDRPADLRTAIVLQTLRLEHEVPLDPAQFLRIFDLH